MARMTMVAPKLHLLKRLLEAKPRNTRNQRAALRDTIEYRDDNSKVSNHMEWESKRESFQRENESSIIEFGPPCCHVLLDWFAS